MHDPSPSSRRRVSQGWLIVGLVAIVIVALLLGQSTGGDPDAGGTVRLSPSPTSASTVPVPTPSRGTAVPGEVGKFTRRPGRPPKRRRSMRAPRRGAPQPTTGPRFASCAEANRAGYGPYRRGIDPEYAWYQDRDGDGVVCER